MKELFEDAKKIYVLPKIQNHFILTDSEVLKYCRERDFISIIVPFFDTESRIKKNILVKNNLFSYIKMYSNLFGGSIDIGNNFLSQAYMEAEKKSGEKLDLQEINPIAIIENYFHYGVEQHVHYGFIYMGRIPKNIKISEKCVTKDVTDKFLFNNNHNELILKFVKNYIDNYKGEDKQVINEIIAAKKINYSQLKSKKELFLKDNNIDLSDLYAFKVKIKNDILSFGPKRIIDVACGDDSLLFDILRENNEIIGYANDVVYKCLEYQMKINKDIENVFFSNHNVKNLPFKKKSFDVLIAKNLFHHLLSIKHYNNYRNFNVISGFIKNALDISKVVIIVEPLNILEQNENGKLLHEKFYIEIAHEVKGTNYYFKNAELQQIILNIKDAVIIENEIIETNNGRYKYVILKHKT